MAQNILQEVKDCLGITIDTQDNQIQCCIDSVIDNLECITGCPLCLGEDETYKEYIDRDDVKFECGYCEFRLCGHNVKEIVSINKVFYVGEEGTDYFITKPNKSKIKLCSELCFNKVGSVEIEYTYGGSKIPSDLFKILASSVEADQGAECGKEIASYKVGDKTVSFCCGSDSTYSLSSQFVQSTLVKYKRPFICASSSKRCNSCC